MAIFDRLDRLTSRTIDRINAVSFVITPQSSTPNGRVGADPNRGEIVGKGIFSQEAAPAGIEVGNRGARSNDMRTLVAGTSFVFSVDVFRYPDAKNVRQGDRLALDDARIFTIASVRPDGMARIDLELTVAGA